MQRLLYCSSFLCKKTASLPRLSPLPRSGGLFSTILKSPSPAVAVFYGGLSSDRLLSNSDNPIIWQVMFNKFIIFNQDNFDFLAKNSQILRVFLSKLPDTLLDKYLCWKAVIMNLSTLLFLFKLKYL